MTLTEQVTNLKKRVDALENTEFSESESIPHIVKLYSTASALPELYASATTQCSTILYPSGGIDDAIAYLIANANYGAVGTGAKPAQGDTGILGEVDRVVTADIIDVDEVVIIEVFLDETAANGSTLTNAALLLNGTGVSGTGKVLAGETLNLEKTSAVTLTLSGEITVTEIT